MRRLLLIAVGSFYTATASAELPMTQAEVVTKARAEFANAKGKPKAIEGIELWCRDSIMAVTLREGVKLKTRALKMMEQNQLDEANTLLKQAESERSLTETVAKDACRPR